MPPSAASETRMRQSETRTTELMLNDNEDRMVLEALEHFVES